MKKWEILEELKVQSSKLKAEDILPSLLKNRGIITKKDISVFLTPIPPISLTPKDVGIDKALLARTVKRIQKAIKNKESIVVYADYDADGITAGAIMWEAL